MGPGLVKSCRHSEHHETIGEDKGRIVIGLTGADSKFESKLRAAGLSDTEAKAKDALFAKAMDALRNMGTCESKEICAFFVPGRIEVLGKHTDYAGGRSLLCTAERGICVVARPRKDATLRVLDCALHWMAEFPLDPSLQPEQGHWSNYPMTVARRLAKNFPAARCGADIVFSSDLPLASGMSSSTALIIAIYQAIAEINGIAQSREYQQNIYSMEDLAGYLATVENGFDFGTLHGDRGVGTFGGSEDQTAIFCCQPGCLSQYSFCPVRHEYTVKLPDDLTFVICMSGIVAEKTGPALETYNRAALTVRRMLELWREATQRNDISLASASLSSPEAPDLLRTILSSSQDREFPAEMLLRRFEQFKAECTEIIPGAVQALERSDYVALGKLVGRSQAGAENALENQIPATITLAHCARSLGAVAASAFGAGFGGSVWALIPASQVQEFTHRWSNHYQRSFPALAEHAKFIATRPAGPAVRL